MKKSNTTTNFTGERYISEVFDDDSEISLSHIKRYEFARKYVSSNCMVLDVACGKGYGSKILFGVAEKVVGIDIDVATISAARKKYKENNLSFIVGDASNINFPDGFFDCVVSFETIEHLNKRKQKIFLKEVYRLLKPGGIFIVSTPDKDVYGRGYNEYHEHEFSRSEFVKFLRKKFNDIVLFGQDIRVYKSKISLKIRKSLEFLRHVFGIIGIKDIIPKYLRNKLSTVAISATPSRKSNEAIFDVRKLNSNKETAKFLVAVCKK